MSEGGKIDPHYDASVDGYINYKCNISVASKDYEINIDRQKVPIQEGDLYCFEASLYKHWTEEFSSRRVFLSCGFMLKYEKLGRSVDDPQVRLSRRIAKYFQ
jgi:aspartyl/asparaginyl beta-hydroxylase (cupin superfamily)